MRGKAISHLPRQSSSKAAPVILAGLLIAGCASSVSPGASPLPNSPSPLATSGPSAQGVPTSFTSTLYGYSVTLPAGWRVVEAQTKWDGNGSPTYDDQVVDQLIAPESTGRCTGVFNMRPSRVGSRRADDEDAHRIHEGAGRGRRRRALLSTIAGEAGTGHDRRSGRPVGDEALPGDRRRPDPGRRHDPRRGRISLQPRRPFE